MATTVVPHPWKWAMWDQAIDVLLDMEMMIPGCKPHQLGSHFDYLPIDLARQGCSKSFETNQKWRVAEPAPKRIGWKTEFGKNKFLVHSCTWRFRPRRPWCTNISKSLTLIPKRGVTVILTKIRELSGDGFPLIVMDVMDVHWFSIIFIDFD